MTIEPQKQNNTPMEQQKPKEKTPDKKAVRPQQPPRQSDNGNRPRNRSRNRSQRPALAASPANAENRARRAAAAGNRCSAWWRQFLIVLVSVAVSLAGTEAVGLIRERNALRREMHLVYRELQENRRLVLHCTEKLIRDRNGMSMFERYEHRLDRIPADSLRRYIDILATDRKMVVLSGALETLKQSGHLRTLDDEKLISQIFGCYLGLTAFADDVKVYNRLKTEARLHLNACGNGADFGSGDPFADWRRLLADPACRAFMRNAGYFGRDNYLRHDIAGVERTIAAIREKYRFE